MALAIQPADLEAQIAAGTGPAILDVRSALEYRRGHLPGARHLAFWRALEGTVAVPREAPIVVYCGHGPRAWMAVAALRLRGFTNVGRLRGHMAAWRRERRPEER